MYKSEFLFHAAGEKEKSLCLLIYSHNYASSGECVYDTATGGFSLSLNNAGLLINLKALIYKTFSLFLFLLCISFSLSLLRARICAMCSQSKKDEKRERERKKAFDWFTVNNG